MKNKLNEAVQWLVGVTQSVGVDLYGGYYGPAYVYEDVLFVVDPGHESQKYSELAGYKLDDVLNFYRRHVELENELSQYSEVCLGVGEIRHKAVQKRRRAWRDNVHDIAQRIVKEISREEEKEVDEFRNLNPNLVLAENIWEREERLIEEVEEYCLDGLGLA